MIRQLLLAVLLVCALCAPAVVSTRQVYAADVVPNCGAGSANGVPDVCKDANSQAGNNGKNSPIVDIIKAAIDILSFIIGVAAIIGIVISSIRLMMAGGDSNAVSSAKSGIIYSLIGVLTVVIAQALVAFVLDKVQ